MSEILYYECKRCGTQIPPNTRGVFRSCGCGRIAIDGTEHYTRIIGDKNFLKQVKKAPEEFVYRIKQVSTGLFFRPNSWKYRVWPFNEQGKFYTRIPSLTWVPDDAGECVIEKYKVSKV